jgi:hypothetical protein
MWFRSSPWRQVLQSLWCAVGCWWRGGQKWAINSGAQAHPGSGSIEARQQRLAAQLTRQTPASCGLALLLAIFLIVPAILYLMLYHGTESLYIEVDEAGNIKATPG